MKKETLTKQKTFNRIKPIVKHNYIEDVFPICLNGREYRINLGGMRKLSPTGDNWGYAPFQKTYKTSKEAKEVRKELWETIVSWVNNYVF